ncbi:hypothetical protein OAQ01_00050 [Emcibacteraceae bacterium]|nr:hypothetical protein [Emcibacteraceae bacterium]
MAKKILLIDPLQVDGHINFNRKLIESANLIGQTTFMSTSEYLVKLKVNNCITVSGFNSDFCSILGFRIKLILIMVQVALKINKEYDIVIFTGYENITFLIVSVFLRHKKILLINHNNLDFKKSKFKSLIFRLIPKRFAHVALEQYIVDYIRQSFNKTAYLVSHPYYVSREEVVAKSPESMEPFEQWIFAPSGSNNWKLVDELAKVTPSTIGILAKYSPLYKNYQNVCLQRWFKYYSEYMKASDFVYIGSEFEYRVSGVLYEALSLGKKILIPDSLYAQKMRQQYPSMVSIITNEFKNSYRETVNFADYKKFLQDHNEERLGKQINFLLVD